LQCFFYAKRSYLELRLFGFVKLYVNVLNSSRQKVVSKDTTFWRSSFIPESLNILRQKVLSKDTTVWHCDLIPKIPNIVLQNVLSKDTTFWHCNNTKVKNDLYHIFPTK